MQGYSGLFLSSVFLSLASLAAGEGTCNYVALGVGTYCENFGWGYLNPGTNILQECENMCSGNTDCSAVFTHPAYTNPVDGLSGLCFLHMHTCDSPGDFGDGSTFYRKNCGEPASDPDNSTASDPDNSINNSTNSTASDPDNSINNSTASDPDNSINGEAPSVGPPKVSFDQDLDPKTRSISGTITIQASAGASNLQGYRFYPSADGSAKIGENATHSINLPKSCPPDSQNDDYENANADPPNTWTPLAKAACNNDSPYSPKCVGDSCGEILIKPGSDGEYYISRYDNTADQTSPGSYQNTYADNETAMIYLPSRGKLKIVSRDIAAGADYLRLEKDKDHGTKRTDLGAAATWTSDGTNDIDLDERESVVTWETDDDGNLATGWTLVFVPRYPTYPMINQKMTDGAGGFRVVPVTGGPGTIVTDTNGGTEDEDNAAFAETYDWLVPNATCTPTTMLCPLPDTWAHVDYSTPNADVAPAEGSCTQVKSDSNFGAAVDFSSCGQGSENERLAPGTRWAGNCAGVTSYFWFEKIACGSTRLFHTARSLIEDKVVLSPSAQHLQDIKDLYYTTKAPETDYNHGGGITWIDPDYHIKPLLPPKVECSCIASMDAYASLLSVVSETPTPDAPETLDPEVLNSGTSKIVATLRVYNDPTYSIPVGDEVPVVVERFYLEVSTKFTRNHITIRDCNAAHEEQYLNETNSVTPLQTRIEYCDQEPYDTRSEGVPNGITHMDRISMKKFKFGATFDVFMQCRIRACQEKPCGTCAQGNLDDPPNPNPNDRRLQYNASPIEGEMFVPPVSFKIGASDDTALVFDAPQRRAPTAAPSSPPEQTAPTSKPLQIHSEISLPLSPSWAIQNINILTQTLRSTLSLLPGEDLVITRISAARRLEKARKLQEGGSAKIDFVVGLGRAERATQAQSSLAALSSGQPTALQETFTTQLDTQLQAAGKPAVALTPSAVSFGVPSQNSVAAVPASAPASWEWTPTVVAQQQPSSNNWALQQQSPQQQQASQEGSANNSLVLILAGSAAALMLLVFAYFRLNVAAKQVDGDQQLPPIIDSYQGKVAALDAQ